MESRFVDFRDLWVLLITYHLSLITTRLILRVIVLIFAKLFKK